MSLWMLIRLILLVIFIIVLIPAIRLMRQVEDLEKTTGKKETEELKKKVDPKPFYSLLCQS